MLGENPLYNNNADLDSVWIFISHSNKDLNQVRKIRDEFESKGLNPLLFFLKCLDDESEVDNLIKREIEARNWFVLCDSPNAQKSRWVQTEIEHIKNLPDKVYEVIDVTSKWNEQKFIIERLCKRVTVYLAYSIKDEYTARLIRDSLIKNEFRVIDPSSLNLKYNDNAGILGSYIAEAALNGYVLILLSPESVKSEWWWYEVKYALANVRSKSNIVPILLYHFYDEKVLTELSLFEWLLWDKGSIESHIDELVTFLKRKML